MRFFDNRYLYLINQYDKKNSIFFPCESKITKSVVRGYSVKNVFLEISQNSQENICVRVSFLNFLLIFIKERDSGTGVFL